MGEGKEKKEREGTKPQEILKNWEQTEGWWGVGGRGGRVMGIEEGTCWDEHWVLYGNQFDNKFHNKKNKDVLKGAPGWLSWLSIWVLISVRVMISRVHEIEPCVRLCADSVEPAWDCLSPPSAPPLVLSRSLSKINK